MIIFILIHMMMLMMVLIIGMFVIFGVICLITIIGALIDRKYRGNIIKLDDDRQESKHKINEILNILQKLKGIESTNFDSNKSDSSRNTIGLIQKEVKIFPE